MWSYHRSGGSIHRVELGENRYRGSSIKRFLIRLDFKTYNEANNKIFHRRGNQARSIIIFNKVPQMIVAEILL